MREILFRGKRADNGELVEGDYTHDPDLEKAYISGFEYGVSETGTEREFFEEIVIPETVGQYTGLTDKNNVKIFEGDILKGCYDEDNPEEYAVFAVLWDNGWRTFQNGREPDFLEELDCRICEVIGNIHDNPELLEGGEDNG